MLFNRFGLFVLLRVGLILVSGGFFLGTLGDDGFFFLGILALLFCVLAVGELIWFVNKSNRDLARFLTGIRYKDYSSFPRNNRPPGPFGDLQSAFEEISAQLSVERIENKGESAFLVALIDQMPAAVIAFKKGETFVFNSQAQELLGVKEARDIFMFHKFFPSLMSVVDSMGESGRRLTDISIGNRLHTLIIEKSTQIILGQPHIILLLRDVGEQMDHRELDSWLKLIRILTHEVMNTATPLSSLTETLLSLLKKEGKPLKAEEVTDVLLADTVRSLETIHRRTDGMLSFVGSYREISKVTLPIPESFDIADWARETVDFMSAEIQEAKVTVEFELESIMVNADRNQLQQVLINLISNALHAMRDSQFKSLTLKTFRNNSQVIVEVGDTGHGIPESIVDSIFVPFFSTREGGSGIGLSLSRQIMYLHGGSIRVESTHSGGTLFTLRFNPVYLSINSALR